MLSRPETCKCGHLRLFHTAAEVNKPKDGPCWTCGGRYVDGKENPCKSFRRESAQETQAAEADSVPAEKQTGHIDEENSGWAKDEIETPPED